MAAAAPTWTQPAAKDGFLLAVRAVQAFTAFMMLVPAGMSADVYRKLSALLRGTGRRTLLQGDLDGILKKLADGINGGVALYVLMLLVALLTLAMSLVWLAYTAAPARRAAAPKWTTRCNATACSGHVWDLAFDGVLLLWYFAIFVASANSAVTGSEGAAAIMCAQMFVLLCVSFVLTFLQRRAKAGAAAGGAAVAPAPAPGAAAAGAADMTPAGSVGWATMGGKPTQAPAAAVVHANAEHNA